MFLDGTFGNKILGKFDTSRNSEYSSEKSENGESETFEFNSKFKEYTSWEVKPDKTCIKRVVQEINDVEVENKETPIDCKQAKKEVKVFQEKHRKELAEELKKVKEEQEKLKKEHAEFAAKIQEEFNKMRSGFNF